MKKKKFIKREEIQEKIRVICNKYFEDHKKELKIDKYENVTVERGFIKGMFSFVNECYTSKIIIPEYTGYDLWACCVVGDMMLEMCSKYNAIPNKTLFSIITGLSTFILGKIENCQDKETLSRLDYEYNRDYKEYFKNVYNRDKTMNIADKVNIYSNTTQSYPLYCILKQIKEMEKDGRIERGRLGDLAQLNAPIELDGFGFAHPAIMVDNRQLIIGNEEKLLKTYANSTKHINSVKVEKEELKNEAIDLFKNCNE